MLIRCVPIRYTCLLLASLLLWAGCSDKVSNVERGNVKQELYISLGTEPATLDPQIATGLTEMYVMLAFFEGLTTFDAETMKILPGVAQSWDISDGGLTYTFHFDPAARWSNGDPVTSQDFLFAFERILTPVLGATYAYMLYPMKNAEAFNKGEIEDFSQVGASAPDERTLVIELNAPTPYFLSMLTHCTWWPVHAPTILAHGSMTDRISKWTRPGNLIGNGPFTLESWRLNNGLVARKNPNYRDADSVRLKQIHFLTTDLEAEERAFRANQLHITESVPIHRLDWYREHRPDSLRISTSLGVYYYLINTEHPPLNDLRVRKALAYAINREELTEHVLKAGQQPAYHFTPPNTGGYNARATFPYDPELARKLLAEAGYPGGKGFPEFELLFNTSEAHKTIATVIQQMWKKELGIDVELYNQEWKVYLATRENGEFDIARASWFGDYDDPNTFLDLGLSDSGNNHSGWKNPEYDALISQAALTTNPEARMELFQQAESILIDEMPFVPIYFYVTSKLVHPSVKGWYPSLLDYHPYQAMWLED
ncbi:peptide ABC transporter substrate-binding protein [Coraliomargarita parva]|uniref:peptide ABC transporter substrate-binding protein n=1 Tax=Coraliomargarita parva TaxID=3014050 RepID=UPI0022B32ADB|nr:peptide ABC transporter substrate-binding protein [Coraliomargarita parva]